MASWPLLAATISGVDPHFYAMHGRYGRVKTESMDTSKIPFQFDEL